MSISRVVTGSIAAMLLASAASAQTYEWVVDPVPAPSDLSDTVRAQFIRPGDISPEEYARLLAEAEKIKSFQESSDYAAAAPVQNVTSGQTYVYDGRPNVETHSASQGIQIELYEAPVSIPVATPTTVIASAPVVSTTASSHIVAKGDTLYNISRRYNVTIDSLRGANAISGNAINIGQVLSLPTARREVTENIYSPASQPTLVRNVEPIPASGVYAVLPGDTLYGIAKRACVDVSEISQTNGLGASTNISPGQRLQMPTGHCLR
ncbi:MAG: LysM peptidoglycan-binding domain-containing protein [Hellea sp.]|nr:LysM peptidoglycan-binding domain-containing protein [Hellea sp.]